MNPAGLCSIVRSAIDPDIGLQNGFEAIACLVHACMTKAGFDFVASVDESSDSPSTTSSTTNTSGLPRSWNATHASSQAFTYKHEHLPSPLLVRISSMGQKVMIVGALDKSASPMTVTEVLTTDYTSTGMFPWSEKSGNSLADAFRSLSTIKAFSSSLSSTFIAKILPQEGQDNDTNTPTREPEEQHARTTQSSHQSDARSGSRVAMPDHCPSETMPQRDSRLASTPSSLEMPPQFEDEYNIQGGSSSTRTPSAPGHIGADDLNPPGIGAMRPFGGMGPHRGMHPTLEEIMGFPEDPDHEGPFPEMPPLRRPPPGARYDPVFPGDRNGLGRGRGLGRGGFNQF